MIRELPEFIEKLVLMVDDQEDNEYIRWTYDGESILVIDPNVFSKNVLVKYFKHSNITSFTRQLNKYGFRKDKQVMDGYADIKSEIWQFTHGFFKKGRIDLRELIRKKVSSPYGRSSEIDGNPQYSCDTHQAVHNQLYAQITEISMCLKYLMKDIVEIKNSLIKNPRYHMPEIDRIIPLRIILFERNENTRLFTRSILVVIGCETRVVEQIKEISELLTTFSPDLLLINGYDCEMENIMAEVREINFNNFYVFTVMEKRLDNDYCSLLELGIDKIIVKPFSPESLYKMLRDFYLNVYWKEADHLKQSNEKEN